MRTKATGPAKVRSTSAFSSMKSVMDAATAKLKTSVLEPADAKSLRLEVYSAEESKKLTGLPAAFAGIMIPYFDLKGRPVKFWRYRYLEDTKTGWDATTDKKALRYAQPKNTAGDIYLPPLAGINWLEIAKDPGTSVIITEGEFKAACATKHGYPTIGLGGVWSFKNSGQRQALLPQLREFNWKDRQVFIAYDSDATSNPQVLHAENALARELMLLGAEPLVIRLKPVKGEKAGIDDVILHLGPERFGQYMDTAVEWKAAQELFQLNQEVVYVKDPGLIMELDTLRRISPRAFVDHAYSTRIYYEQQVSDKGTKLVERSAAKEWLKWPARAEVARVTYSPGEDKVTGRNELNVWPGWGVEPKRDDELIKLWHELTAYIFRGDKDALRWFTQWCAYPLQHPGRKMYSCVAVWGLEHGTGKSFLGYLLGSIYGRNFTEIKDKDIQKSDNDWAENKQFVMGSEITGGDKRHSAEDLKNMITQLEIRINIKYIPRFTVADVINYYFTSNHPDSFFLEDKDRRYFIWEVVGDPLPREFYRKLDKHFKDKSLAAALFHYLLHVDLKGFDPHGPAPMTDAKLEMTESGRSDIGNWIAQLKSDPDSVLRMDKVTIKYELFRADDLLALYDPDGRGKLTVNGMARELKRAGFRRPAGTIGCRTSRGQVRLWAVRNPKKFEKMSPDQIGIAYDAERGRDADGKSTTDQVRRKKKF